MLTIYVLLLGLARVLLSDGIQIDEAEQSYLSQWFSLGYDIQPPLYTWLTIGLNQVFGNHYWVYVFFRMVLLLFSFYGLYRIFSHLGKDTKIGLAAIAFSLLLFQFSTESLRQTHTVLVTLASILTILCLIRIKENSELKDYILLGVALSMGILAKYNFLILVSSLCIAVALLPQWRSFLFTWKTGVTALIVILLVSPHFVWVLQHLNGLVTDVGTDLGTDEEFGFLSGRVKGLGKLFEKTFGFLVGFLIVFGGFHFKQFKTARKNSSEWIQFFEYFFLAVILQFILLVLIFNATNFTARWMQPFFVLFPGYCFLKFYPNGIPLKSWKPFKWLGYIGGIAIISVVIARTAVLPALLQKPVWLNKPHTQFCEDMQPILQEHQIDLIVTNHILLGGYFRMVYPERKVIVLEEKYARISDYQLDKNTLIAWSWAWVEGKEDGVKKGKAPKDVVKTLQSFNGERIEVDMITYDYHYCPTKKCSYDYIILKN
ncbi:MAG: ArnT family glycosyltransferase [Chitinophagales bacterium]